jgi:hypothetical protein
VQLVDENSAQALSADAAVATLDELRARVQKDPALRLTLAWRLERRS